MTTHTRPAGPRGDARPAGRPLALGSMCTGYGGLDIAVSAVLDVEPAWVADPDPGAAAILAHHWPDVPNLGDITAVDWTTVPPVDVLCAGYPCQPFSHAGKRKGTADERHLWPHIADALRVLRPRLAVFENVANHLRLGFADVLADLAGLGFDAEWCLVRADEVGAAHRRNRLFLLAWPVADADGERVDRPATQQRAVGREVATRDAATHPDGLGREGQRRRAGTDTERQAPAAFRPRLARSGLALAHAARDGRDEGRPQSARLLRRPDAALGRDADAHAESVRHGHTGTPGRGRVAAPALAGAPTDAHRDPIREQPVTGPRSGRPAVTGVDSPAWGDYAPAIDRWARVLGRPAPAPTEPGRDGRPRLSPRFVEWLMGLDHGHVTGVPGLTRNQMLKALGNGVVPQQGAAALAHLLDRMEAA